MNILLFNEASMEHIISVEPPIKPLYAMIDTVESDMNDREKVLALDRQLKELLSFVVAFYEGVLAYGVACEEGEEEGMAAFVKAVAYRTRYNTEAKSPLGLLLGQCRNLLKATQVTHKGENMVLPSGNGLNRLMGRVDVWDKKPFELLVNGDANQLNLSNIVDQVIYGEEMIHKSSRVINETDYENFYHRCVALARLLIQEETAVYPYKIQLVNEKSGYYCVPKQLNKEIDLKELFKISTVLYDDIMTDCKKAMENEKVDIKDKNRSEALSKKNSEWEMPAEWAEHMATFLLWPHRSDIWKNAAQQAELSFVEVAKAISAFEPVYVVVIPLLADRAKVLLGEGIQVIPKPYSDAWMRDIGPTIVMNKEGCIKANDWVFNAWGGELKGLYAQYAEDDAVAKTVSTVMGITNDRISEIILEGGSIHTDGERTLLSTRECLFNAGRNSYDEATMEQLLKYYLGVDKVIWLDYGLMYDETNGHIDNICCFSKPGEVLLSWTEDTNHPSYERVRLAHKQLRDAVDAKGRKLNIIHVLLPDPIVMTIEEAEKKDEVYTTLGTTCHDQLPASYINFYICNDAIILPQFNVPLDLAIQKQFKEIFPERKIVCIDTREIILGGGNIHCITQQIPKGI